MVINSGRITGIVDGAAADKQEIGLLMTGNISAVQATEKEGNANG